MRLESEACDHIAVSLKAFFEKRVWVIFYGWNLMKLGVSILLINTYSSHHNTLGYINHNLGQKIHLSTHSSRKTFFSRKYLHLALGGWPVELEMILILKLPSIQIVFIFEICIFPIRSF